MPIEYTAIARDSTIICSHQQDQLNTFSNTAQSTSSFINENYNPTNYSLLVSNILPNISSSSDGNTSYTTNNELTIRVTVCEGLVFLCACNEDVTKQRAFDFLLEIKGIFMDNQALVHRALTATTNELNRDFAPIISKKMVEFSKAAPAADGLSKVQAQVEDVKGVMTKNIEAVLDRGERLEDLIDKSNDLEANASSFQRSTRRVHRHMRWKNIKSTLILALTIIVVIIIIVLVILFSTGALPVKTATTATTFSPVTFTTKDTNVQASSFSIHIPPVAPPYKPYTHKTSTESLDLVTAATSGVDT